MAKRKQQLQEWTRKKLGDDINDIEPASEDASFRRYFRTTRKGNSGHPDETYILMDAPPEKEDCGPFIKIANYFENMGLSAPRILHQDLEQGFLILSDLGTQQYLSVLDDELADQLYSDAIYSLVKMQKNGAEYAKQLPAYDEALLLNEMSLFPDWYLKKHLKYELKSSDTIILDNTFKILSDVALQQPRVFVHRDFHSRNLMYANGEGELNPGIIDFQDAVYGPVTYDIVSLLRDCYVLWSDENVAKWLSIFYAGVKDVGVIKNVSLDEFTYWFDLMGLQRHLKAIGIFSRLNYRDNKDQYLFDIPRTLHYVYTVSERHPELAEFHRFIEPIHYGK